MDDIVNDDVEAYVLGALSPDEAAGFAERLAASPELRRRVDEARVVTWLLAGSPPQLSPPADLRARILAAADAERDEDVPPARTPSLRTVPARARAGAAAAAGWTRWLAAAALLLALGLGGWNALLQQQLGQQQAEIERQQAELTRNQAELARNQVMLEALGGAERFWTMRGTPEHAPGATSMLALNPSERQTVFIVRGFPTLPAGQTYQVWVIQNGQPVSVGSFAPASPDSEQVLVIPSDLSGVTQAAITIEPAGGSLSPTGPRVMGGDL